MSAVTGRTHLDWRYRTLKARRDSTVRCKARLADRLLKIEKPGPIFLNQTESLKKRVNVRSSSVWKYEKNLY